MNIVIDIGTQGGLGGCLDLSINGWLIWGLCLLLFLDSVNWEQFLFRRKKSE